MNTKPDFSKLSPLYDFLGIMVFFGVLQRSQTVLLPKLSMPAKTLIIGGGTGKFLVYFLKFFQESEITYIDISPGMIKQARKKIIGLPGEDRVNFICGGIESIPEMEFDFICTHYFLDCFEEQDLNRLFIQLKKRLKPDGIWHFTDFYLDGNSPFLHRKLVGFLYWFFRLSCGLKVKKLADFKTMFNQNELKLIEECYFRGRLMRTAIYTGD